ncbi:MAG: methylated-DNA--[protein]-cysteine S-methyltransferase [Tannerella sp.]|jgi:methylated-DNA-[protein]-cysteine S-methyltransferase|nr:methylated-DNA--[protein]-cysteine S-methyltransferase [Tannerella sp.]
MNYFIKYDSPVGTVRITENGAGITSIEFPKSQKYIAAEEKETPLLKKTVKQLAEYFAGKRKEFDLPLHLSGTTFQTHVWRKLMEVPYGETRSYKQVAEAAGNPKASRAIGLANNRNRIPILIPCHRIIGADGSLTGYAGGLDTKKFLLDLERKFAQ